MSNKTIEKLVKLKNAIQYHEDNYAINNSVVSLECIHFMKRLIKRVKNKEINEQQLNELLTKMGY